MGKWNGIHPEMCLQEGTTENRNRERKSERYEEIFQLELIPFDFHVMCTINAINSAINRLNIPLRYYYNPSMD